MKCVWTFPLLVYTKKIFTTGNLGQKSCTNVLPFSFFIDAKNSSFTVLHGKKVYVGQIIT